MTPTLSDDTIRGEVANFLETLASRSQKLISEKSEALIAFLEKNTTADYPSMLDFVRGFTSFTKTDFKQAKELFEGGLLKSVSYPSLAGAHHFGIGFCQRSLGDLDDAVSHIYQAIELINKKGNFKRLLAYCYHVLGEINVAIAEYPRALEYFNKEFELYGEGGPQGMALFRVLNGMGGCYQNMKEYEKGREYLMNALAIEGLTQEVVSRGQNDLGTLLLEMKMYEEAEQLLRSSLQIREECKLEDAASTSMIGLTEVFLAQGRSAEAEELLTRCKAITDKFKTKQKQIRVLHLLARANSANGNFENAAKLFDQYNTLTKEVKSEQEKKIFRFKNEQIEKQRKIIADKHSQLTATFEEIKRLKINRKSIYFSWLTVVVLVMISEVFLDPLIENYSYNNFLSLAVKVFIALLFKPIDGMYEKILWERTMKKAVSA